MRLSWFIAAKIGKRGRGKLSRTGNIIAVCSVAVSLLVMLIAIAVSAGFRHQINDKMVGIRGDMLISPPSPTPLAEQEPQSFYLTPLSYIDDIKQLPYVESVAPISYIPGIIKTDEHIQGVILQGVDSSFNFDFIKESLLEGEIPFFASANSANSAADSVSTTLEAAGSKAENKILISRQMADMLGFAKGDKITFYFISNPVKVRRLEIAGIYSANFENFDKRYIICSKELVDRLSGLDSDEANLYQIYFTEHSQKLTSLRKDEIMGLIYEKMNETDPAVSITSVYDNMYQLVDWLNLLDVNVLIILVLMIAVAGFNMICCMLIILFENISAIGVLKSLGMSDNGVLKVFLAKSCKVVLSGIAIGNIIALLFFFLQSRYNIITLNPENYFLSSVPIKIGATTILAVDILSFLIILLMVALPCRRICRTSIAKMLRFK